MLRALPLTGALLLGWLATPYWRPTGNVFAQAPDAVQPAEEEKSTEPVAANKPANTDEPAKPAAADEAAPAESSDNAQASESDEQARQARIKELLSLVSDNTLFNHKRENPAYFALLKEVLRQTPEQLRSQARDNPRFNDFYRKPAEHRGEVVHLVLNLRRILPIDIHIENEAGVKRIYELWGWTDEAKAFMYCCITPELPPGLPSEGDVDERIEVTGYFFKMQAYQPGDAAPNARNLVAPVVIGRIVSSPKPVAAEGPGLGQWPLVLILGFAIVIAMRLVMQARGGSRFAPTHRHYRRRSLEPLDTDRLGDSLSSADKGLEIRNADE
ncbi:MAG: hypothetical protein ACTHOU_22085 [Aureliella sp.]